MEKFKKNVSTEIDRATLKTLIDIKVVLYTLLQVQTEIVEKALPKCKLNHDKISVLLRMNDQSMLSHFIDSYPALADIVNPSRKPSHTNTGEENISSKPSSTIKNALKKKKGPVLDYRPKDI